MAEKALAEIAAAILDALPTDRTAVGNAKLREIVATRLGFSLDEADYIAARATLIREGVVATGKGRGGSVRRTLAAVASESEPLTLEAQAVPESAKRPKPQQSGLALQTRKTGEPTRAARKSNEDPKLIAYRHDQKRRNNPDVGVVTPETDPEQPKTTWAFDPHIDPALKFDVTRAGIENLIDDALASGDEASMRTALETLRRMAAPYLDWTGKAERTSFEIDTVSLHVHERIDPATILAALRKRMSPAPNAKASSASPSPRARGEGARRADEGQPEHASPQQQTDFFRAWFEDPLPYREAIEFYKHDRGWANRLVAGDSLLVMNSLLKKEGMAGQVQMIYIDPPYGIKYGSNFQPFVNKRDVKDRSDADLTAEPEMIKAFRDTWELGIHSYLTYLRDRLLLARELLHESGSVFVQISDENLHLVRNLLDEVFGKDNICGLIAYKTTAGLSSAFLATAKDWICWYGKEKSRTKFRRLYADKEAGSEGATQFGLLQRSDGSITRAPEAASSRAQLIQAGGRQLGHDNLTSTGFTTTTDYTASFRQKSFALSGGSVRWKTPPDGMAKLDRAGRLMTVGNTLRYKRFLEDFPVFPLVDVWNDTGVSGFADKKTYVVQTNAKVIERCLLMTTDPGDLAFDPTCGSGTTAFVAEKWGRRWITCDTSRVAITLAKQRLMTASFDYYALKYPHEGLRGGFMYKTVPHVTLKSIANNPEIDEIWAKLHPAVETTLANLNTALVGWVSDANALRNPPLRLAITEGGRKGQLLDFSATTTSGGSRPALLEWEVPFEWPGDWPEVARAAFEAFHAARQTMQNRMDRSIAEHADQETLFDQPAVAKDKLRITGPFTVEAVPFPTVLALDDADATNAGAPRQADASVARSGESARQHSWRDELLKTGIRGVKRKDEPPQLLKFSELETLPGTRHVHCSGHLDSGERVVVSFGPEHAALEQRQVELAMREAGELFPRPKMIVFCAFTFDPEAAKDIDAQKGITALKVQMNVDLLTEDLKKARSSNQSFWLMGQPDVEVRGVDAQGAARSGPLRAGEAEFFVVEVRGFDYFNSATGNLESGGRNKIAAWALDTDYDERSLFPRQVFFPMAGDKDGWNKLKRDIRAELDDSLLQHLHGTVSLPFEAGTNRKIAVKIVDDRGIESLKVISLS